MFWQEVFLAIPILAIIDFDILERTDPFVWARFVVITDQNTGFGFESVRQCSNNNLLQFLIPIIVLVFFLQEFASLGSIVVILPSFPRVVKCPRRFGVIFNY